MAKKLQYPRRRTQADEVIALVLAYEESQKPEKPTELEDFQKILQPGWLINQIETYHYIKPKSGRRKLFKLYQWQKAIITVMVMLWTAGLPVRFWVGKSRQRGVTTLIQSIMHELCRQLQDRNGITISHQAKSGRKIFSKQKLLYRAMPDSERLPLEGGKPGVNRVEWEYPHSSEITQDTAGGEEVERGTTNHFAHLTEVDFWKEQLDNFTNFMKTVPDKNETPYTMVVGESTGNGQRMMKEQWDNAHRPGSDWIPIFIGYLTDEKAWDSLQYNEQVDPEEWIAKYGVEGDEADRMRKEFNEACEKWGDVVMKGFPVDNQEEDYAKENHLAPQRIKWFRRMRNDECGGSWPKAHQEYPVAARYMFLFTGWPVFEPSIIEKKLQCAREPIYVGEIDWARANTPKTQLLDAFRRGPLKIWAYPKKDKEYVVGMDTSEGIGADFTVILIMQIHPIEIVAIYWSNRISPTDAGIKAYQLASWYNWAFCGVERNHPGLTPLSVLQHPPRAVPQMHMPYPSLYYEIKGEADERTPQETKKVGWPAKQRTKADAIVHAQELIRRENPEINSIELLLEMQGLKSQPPTTLKAKATLIQDYKNPDSELFNDDLITGLYVANEMRLFRESQRFTERVAVKYAEWQA